MEHFLLGCRVVGSWLLVAGPVYQAALELMNSDFRFAQLRELTKGVSAPKVSRWWWLLPPVRMVLKRVQMSRYQAAVFNKLGREQREAMMTFSNKSVGWLYVAGGGFLLAMNETHELTETFHLTRGWLAGICGVMLVLCVSNAAVRASKTTRIIEGETR
jgi:hypothetical protein